MSYKLEVEFVDVCGTYEMFMQSEKEPNVYLNANVYPQAEYVITVDEYNLHLPFHLVRSIAIIEEKQ